MIAVTTPSRRRGGRSDMALQRFEFRIMRFGKPMAETVVVEGQTVVEARMKARAYLGIGEYLGRLELDEKACSTWASADRGDGGSK